MVGLAKRSGGLCNCRYEVVNVTEESLYTNVTLKLFKVRPDRRKKKTEEEEAGGS